jgi:hypothetical protein
MDDTESPGSPELAAAVMVVVALLAFLQRPYETALYGALLGTLIAGGAFIESYVW